MTFSFLWFTVGLAVGVNATLAGLWWSLRRENRKALNEARESLDADLVWQKTKGWTDVHELRDSYGRPMPLASRRADQ